MTINSSTDFSEAKTVVFWDIEDFKIPNGLNLCTITNNIKTVLETKGYHGTITIKVYADETNQNIHEDDFDSNGIKLIRVQEGSSGKAFSRDQCIWTNMAFGYIEHYEPLNMIVIADNVNYQPFDKFGERYNVLWFKLSAEGTPIDQTRSCPRRVDTTCLECGVLFCGYCGVHAADHETAS